MITKILSRIVPGGTPQDERKHSRLQEDFATILINGNKYAIKDWSRGGTYFKAPGHSLSVGDHLNFNLKFDLPHDTINIAHSGRIVRKHHDGFALSFDALTPQTRQNLIRVMDGIISRGFADTPDL